MESRGRQAWRRRLRLQAGRLFHRIGRSGFGLIEGRAREVPRGVLGRRHPDAIAAGRLGLEQRLVGPLE